MGDTFRALGRYLVFYFLPVGFWATLTHIHTRTPQHTIETEKDAATDRKREMGSARVRQLFLDGVFLHTRSRFSGLLLFRAVGVETVKQRGRSDLIRVCSACVCVCACVLISQGVFLWLLWFVALAQPASTSKQLQAVEPSPASPMSR